MRWSPPVRHDLHALGAALLGALRAAGKKGVSFDKLHAECGFKNRKSTRDALYLLSAKNGPGIKGTGENIRIRRG